MVNGGLLFGAHSPGRVFDLETLEVVATGPRLADKGGYGVFQDRAGHYGSSTAYLKLAPR